MGKGTFFFPGHKERYSTAPLPGFYIRRCPPCEVSKWQLPAPIRRVAQRVVSWWTPGDVCNVHRMTLDMPENMTRILSKKTP